MLRRFGYSDARVFYVKCPISRDTARPALSASGTTSDWVAAQVNAARPGKGASSGEDLTQRSVTIPKHGEHHQPARPIARCVCHSASPGSDHPAAANQLLQLVARAVYRLPGHHQIRSIVVRTGAVLVRSCRASSSSSFQILWLLHRSVEVELPGMARASMLATGASSIPRKVPLERKSRNRICDQRRFWNAVHQRLRPIHETAGEGGWSLLEHAAELMLRLLNEHDDQTIFRWLRVEETGFPLPLPGDMAMLMAGYPAGQGKINAFWALALLELATLLSGSILYLPQPLGLSVHGIPPAAFSRAVTGPDCFAPEGAPHPTHCHGAVPTAAFRFTWPVLGGAGVTGREQPGPSVINLMD